MTDKDAFLSNNKDDGDGYHGNLGITDAVDTKPSSVVPFWSDGEGIYKGISKGEWDEAVAGAGDILGNAVAFAMDPLNWLISAGLTFIIDFFQPLEDLLSLVTGNSERLQPYADKWKEMAAALPPLGDAIVQAATDHLVEWQGKDADAAKKKLTEFAAAVKATGGEADSISGLLSLFSAIMNAAQQIIIGILATLIEWAIITWTAAMAAAAPTFGGSVAAAGTATTVEVTVSTSRAVSTIDRVVTILNKLGGMLEKILPGALKSRVGSSVVQFGAEATLKNLGKISLSTLTDPRGLISPIVTLGSGIYKGATSDGSDMSDEQIDDALDKNK